MTLSGFDLCRAALAVTDITAPEQSVLMVLAIMANADAQCWPGINGAVGLTGKTKLSERTVQRAVQGLKDAGHINWVDRPGRGRIYVVHPRHGDTPSETTPATVTPRQSDTPVTVAATPVTVAPKQPRSTRPTKASPSSEGGRAPAARNRRIPPNWAPAPFPIGSVAASAANRFEPGRLERELAKFRDHFEGNGKPMADWDATWRKWVTRSDDFQPQRNRSFNDRPSGAIEARRRAREQYGVDDGDGACPI